MTDYDRTRVTETVERDPVDDRVYRERRVTRSGPTGGEVVRRAVALLFGILQALLLLRIVLLLLVANPGNDIVHLILGVTDPFVEPFRGMFSLDRVTGNSGSTLDVAAIVALIGWTLIEAVILAVLSLGARRGEDATV